MVQSTTLAIYRYNSVGFCKSGMRSIIILLFIIIIIIIYLLYLLFIIIYLLLFYYYYLLLLLFIIAIFSIKNTLQYHDETFILGVILSEGLIAIIENSLKYPQGGQNEFLLKNASSFWNSCNQRVPVST